MDHMPALTYGQPPHPVTHSVFVPISGKDSFEVLAPHLCFSSDGSISTQLTLPPSVPLFPYTAHQQGTLMDENKHLRFP